MIFSTTAKEYEHSNTDMAKSDSSVFIDIILIAVHMINITDVVMYVWDLSMAVAFAVTSAIIGLVFGKLHIIHLQQHSAHRDIFR